jgi:hypothetical protein
MDELNVRKPSKILNKKYKMGDYQEDITTD